MKTLRTHTRLLVTALATILSCASGCDDAKKGPKREDDEAAHARRYHPNVQRTDAVGTPQTSGPAPVTQPADIVFNGGPIGCPVLFVNGETLTVQEVIEPILDGLKEKAETLDIAGYRNYLFRTVNSQIDYQITLLALCKEAELKFSEDRVKEALTKEAERMVQDVINRRYGGVEAKYEAHLKALDLTLDEIKKRAEKQIMVTQFLHDRFRPLVTEPTRRELVRYYEGHLDEFTTPTKAQMLLIEIPMSAGAADRAKEVAEARSQLTKALDELRQGKDFAEVARTYSKGVRAPTGGDWGEITAGSLTRRWAKAAEVLFTLQAGQVSGIVETEESLFVVKCGQRTEQRTLAFEEAQEEIITKLADEEFNRRRDEYIRDLLSQATIRRRPEFFQAVLVASPRPAQLNRPAGR